MIDWKYDILFSFHITHPGPRPDDIFIAPTTDCRRIMQTLGMIYKNTPSGGMVIQEKRVQPDDSLVVHRPIQELTAFTFLLGLKNTALAATVKPFTGTLLEFAGRRRVLYFDNLDDSHAIDTGLSFPAQITPIGTDLAARHLPANGTAVDTGDLASLAPNEFTLLADPAQTNHITLAAKRPNPPADQTFAINANNRRVDLELETGAFHLEKTGAVNTTEILFADQALLVTDSLGIIRIYKDENVDYTTTIRYDINFENA